MFDKVAREEFDREVAARITAQAQASEREQSLLLYRTLVTDLRQQLKDKDETYSQQFREMIALLKPVSEPVSKLSDTPVPQELSYLEIMAIPASTRREMALRERMANVALDRERKTKEESDQAQRNALMTEADEGGSITSFDATLGVLIEPMSEGEAVHDNH